MKYIRRGTHIKKTMKLLSLLLGIGGIAILFLAGALNPGIGWIGLVMLMAGAGGVLVIAFVEGSGNDIGSYRNPRT